MAKATMSISPAFDDFIFDWNYETYLSIGSYGSGKSHAIVQKIILKLYEEKRKACVFRDVYDTHKESTFDLFKQVLDDLGLLAGNGVRTHKTKVCFKNSPLEFKFPNGSRIIFKGMDSTEKLKSLNGVSIVWIEECSEVSYDAYLEILGRIRTKNVSMHFILSCNPVGKFNWVYQQFFEKINDDGSSTTILKDEVLYEQKKVIRKNMYYHHSTCDDNPFLPENYIKRLDELKIYDYNLWVVARLGRFGSSGLRVLPQFEVMNHKLVENAVDNIPYEFHRVGMDFGFETSYNAVIRVAIDDKRKWLYIYKEYYRNKMTDDRTVKELERWDVDIKEDLIKADNAEPKTIRYFRQQGFNMMPCRKQADKKSEGSRIANTKKVKRFRRIICSSDCPNTIKELKDLTYKKKKGGEVDYSNFNIDAHTFSAIWYALDDYTVADLKKEKNNSKKGV